MKLGFLFAGQGAQRVGMGRELYETYPTFQKIFDEISLDFNVKSTCFHDPEGILNETQYTQPCMVAYATALTAVLGERGIAPSAVAGLSLGEYSALHAAGVMDAQAAISLVAFRGKVMAEAVNGVDCAMVAVLGLERETLQSACTTASTLGVVEIANYNCPGQLVIGGETAAVQQAATLAKEMGAKRCLPLKVSGPFHTSLMKPAGDALSEKLQTAEFVQPNIPVFFNCLGGENGENIPISILLERQVQSAVYLEDCIRKMAELELDGFVEIGPGKTMAGFVRKIAPQIPVWSVETAEEIEHLATQCAEWRK